MNLTEDLQKIEVEAVAILEFLTGKPSQASQLERIYIKVITYLIGFFLNAKTAIAATAKAVGNFGGIDAYRDRIIAISPEIADAGLTNPSGNNLVIHLLAVNGQPSANLLGTVQATMQADANRMICDIITAQPATASNYTINAALTLSFTGNEQTVIASATAAIKEYTDTKQKTLGGDIIRTDLINILRDFPDIKDVNLTIPATNITIPPQSYPFNTSTVLNVAGRI